MTLIKKTEAMPQRPVVIVLYGLPGTGKTSLFNTSKNPVLIDCDRGADRSLNRPDTIIANRWEDIIADRDALAAYDTIGIDTAKAMLDDFLMDYVKRTDDVCRRNTQKAYGALGNEFKAFIAGLRAAQKDIVIIAHAKEDKDGDQTKFYPDVTGGSKDLLLRIADQVGFLSTVNNERTVFFEPNDRIIGKNVAGLPATRIPDAGTPEFAGFMDGIIGRVKRSIQEKDAAQVAALKQAEELKDAVELIEDAELADAFFKKLKDTPKATQIALKPLFKERCDALGLAYNKETKSFEKCSGLA